MSIEDAVREKDALLRRAELTLRLIHSHLPPGLPAETASNTIIALERERLLGWQTPVITLSLDEPRQPLSGYTKNVTPRGPVTRPEDAFPESCCEGAPATEEPDE